MSSSSEAEFGDEQPLSALKSKSKTTDANGNGGAKKGTSSRSSRNRKRSNFSYGEDDDDDGGESEDDFQPKRKKTKSNGKRKKKDSDDDDDDDDASDSEEDFKEKPKRKKKTKTKTAPKKKAAAKPKAKAKAPAKPKGLKKLEKGERIAHSMQSFLWWDAPDPPEGCNWTTMEHAGVSFTEKYEPHGVKMKYDGVHVNLSSMEEEAATLFAAMDPDGMHLGNPKTAPIFIKNFFTDFKEILDKKHKIKKFEKCDFEPIRRHLNEQKMIRKAITDEEKKLNKAGRNETMFKFGFSLVDGHIEKVGNYNIEPPAAFRGRGEHPKMGKLKHRVHPEQVKLNLSECAPIPICDAAGHAWGELRHDPQVQWLCQWTENINNSVKYMQLAAQSSFKGKSDRSKYSKAALLCANIGKIRAAYRKKLKAKDNDKRQVATAMWVIDRLALRVGGEKDTEEEADTVGCCSLRVEHLHFDPNGNNTEEGDRKILEIELEFLGKDSMLFKQTIDFGAEMYNENNGMGEQVFKNFETFCKRKKDTDEVFNDLTPTILNTHLKEIMDGLSAKVFRTYNASITLQDELRKTEELSHWNDLTVAEKVTEYNNANRQVAILCNHQKTVSRAQETALETFGDKITKLKKQKGVLKKILAALNTGKNAKKIPLKKDEKKLTEKVAKSIAKAKKMKENATTNEEKIAATEADLAAKQSRRDLADKKFEQAHLWEKTPSKDQVAKKIQSWTQKIAKAEMNLKHKDDNKEVSLGTSKINYMDPRISVAWCKRNEVPIEKIFSKTLTGKFNWAMAVLPEWEFNAEIGKQG